MDFLDDFIDVFDVLVAFVDTPCVVSDSADVSVSGLVSCSREKEEYVAFVVSIRRLKYEGNVYMWISFRSSRSPVSTYRPKQYQPTNVPS
jgi:hypothetical protein